MSFEDYKAFVAEYTLEKTAEMTGAPKDQLEQLAQPYADPNKKVISLLDDGLQPAYSWRVDQQPGLQPAPADRQNFRPGCGPFSDWQPSACGTAREWHLCHRLPADMVVTNEKHRDICEKKWNIPSGTIPAKIGLHAVSTRPCAERRQAECLLTMCTNNMQAGPNINEERMPGWRDPRNFIIA